MIQLDVSRIKNIPGEEQHLVMDVRIQKPVESGVGLIYFESPLKLDVFLANEDGLLKLSGFLEGEIRLACGRCLDLFDMPVQTEINEVYYNESQYDGDPGEEWVSFRGDKLDITPEVAKAVISSLPMKLLCREDCRGLCQRCGTNLNNGSCGCSEDDIDPRMEVLKKLLEKGNN